MRWVLYAIAFLVEIAAWCAAAGLAFVALTGWAAWVVAVLIFIAVVTSWGIFMAPKATHPVPTWAYYLIKGVFYLAVAILIWRWNTALGITFAAAVAISEPALFVRRREEIVGTQKDPGSSPG